MSAEARLTELEIELPDPFPPVGRFRLAKTHGDTVYLSGHGPVRPEGGFVVGKVGDSVSVEEAKEAARLTGLVMLSTLKHEIGSLDRVTSIVKLLGMVNTAPGFTNTPEVINGCSELLVDVFGEEIGAHARSAVGMATLPFEMSVEIEMVVGIGS
jgi:enamine deaminase RidA (YjgF/YER057c/UK114 family)